MDKGICKLSVIPVRALPSDKSEIVNQLLFGEIYSILNIEEKWVQVKIDHDNYKGWIDKKQLTVISGKWQNRANQNYSISYDLVHPVVIKNKHIPILMGSKLYDFDGINCTIGGDKATYNGLAVSPRGFDFTSDKLVKTALKYLNAPYLWGGRSPFGIDCSGLTQNVYHFFGINLPRDAYQQANEGQIVGFVEQALPGDLAFFDREEDGHIIHVGIILEDKKIIHASGEVRIDILDHYGIFNKAENKYTHKLRLIKRIKQ